MRIWACVLLAVLPVQALALSCLQSTVAGTYRQAQASDDAYVVVLGRLSFNAHGSFPHPSPDVSGPMPPELTKVPARLTGKALSRSGFSSGFDKGITLEVYCLSAWCGTAQNGAEVLAFVRKEDGQYSLAAGPCGGWKFTAPTPAMLRQAKQCMRGGPCPVQ